MREGKKKCAEKSGWIENGDVCRWERFTQERAK